MKSKAPMKLHGPMSVLLVKENIAYLVTYRSGNGQINLRIATPIRLQIYENLPFPILLMGGGAGRGLPLIHRRTINIIRDVRVTSFGRQHLVAISPGEGKGAYVCSGSHCVERAIEIVK